LRWAVTQQPEARMNVPRSDQLISLTEGQMGARRGFALLAPSQQVQ
jgi:hypothetical protein